MEPDDDYFHRSLSQKITSLIVVTAGEGGNSKSLTIVQGSFHPVKANGAITFLDASTALAGDPQMIRAAMDRSSSAPPEDSERNAKVRELIDSYDVWFLSAGPVAEYFADRIAEENLGDAMHGNLLSSVLQASGGLKFEAGGVLFAGEAIARSAKDAAGLRDVIRFLAGLVQINKGPGPRASLADTLQVTAEGSMVRLSLSMPEAVAERLFVPKAPPTK
jgi:hypothetical protein